MCASACALVRVRVRLCVYMCARARVWCVCVCVCVLCVVLCVCVCVLCVCVCCVCVCVCCVCVVCVCVWASVILGLGTFSACTALKAPLNMDLTPTTIHIFKADVCTCWVGRVFCFSSFSLDRSQDFLKGPETPRTEFHPHDPKDVFRDSRKQFISIAESRFLMQHPAGNLLSERLLSYFPESPSHSWLLSSFWQGKGFHNSRH